MDKPSQSRRVIELGIDDQMFAEIAKLTIDKVFAGLNAPSENLRVSDVFSGAVQPKRSKVTKPIVVYKSPALHR